MIVKLKKTPKLVTKIFQKIPDHPYKILIIGGLGCGKTNSLLNLINYQSRIDKIYQYAKDLAESKHQYLIDKREKADMKHFKDFETFIIEFSKDIKDVYENINYFNRKKDLKILIVFDDMIAGMISNKNLKPIVILLFLQYFAVPRNIRLNSKHYFIIKIPSK